MWNERVLVSQEMQQKKKMMLIVPTEQLPFQHDPTFGTFVHDVFPKRDACPEKLYKDVRSDLGPHTHCGDIFWAYCAL